MKLTLGHHVFVLSLVFAIVSLLTALSGPSAVLASGLAPAPLGGPVADYPNVDNVNVAQDCIGNGNVRLTVNWTEYNLGPKWLDLSLSNNGWAPGTFVGLGPVPSGQPSAVWDGLLPGLPHYLRVNTLTAFGWQASQTVAFFTRGDCLAAVAPPMPCPAPEPSGPNVFARPAVTGCVWTLKGEGAVYAVGEPVTVCYSVSAPVHIQIVISRPDGSTSIAAEGDDDGTGGCLAPGATGLPRGVRTVTLNVGLNRGQVSGAHYDVE